MLLKHGQKLREPTLGGVATIASPFENLRPRAKSHCDKSTSLSTIVRLWSMLSSGCPVGRSANFKNAMSLKMRPGKQIYLLRCR